MQRLYAVYDLVAKQCLDSVLVQAHDAPAIRAFADACKMPQTLIGQHPEDFELRYIGDLLKDGHVIAPSEPHTVALGSQVKAARSGRMPVRAIRARFR